MRLAIILAALCAICLQSSVKADLKTHEATPENSSGLLHRSCAILALNWGYHYGVILEVEYMFNSVFAFSAALEYK